MAIDVRWYVSYISCPTDTRMSYIFGVDIVAYSCIQGNSRTLGQRIGRQGSTTFFILQPLRLEPTKLFFYTHETDLSNFVGRNHSAIDRLPQEFVERHQRPEKPRAGTRREMQHHEHQHHRTASTDKCAKQRRHD